MKRALLLVIPSLLATRAAAQVVYSQPPSGGMLSFQSSQIGPGMYDSDYDQYVWDNFTLASNASIGEISWRGGYVAGHYYGGLVSGFYISIYGNSIANEPDIINPALKTWTITGSASETLVSQAGQLSVYDYHTALPTTFAATAGQQYWLLIAGIQSGPTDWALASGSSSDPFHHYFACNAGMGDFRYYMMGGDAAFSLMTVPPFGTWNNTGGGNWNTSNRWLNQVPNAIDAVANFGTAITSSATVTVNVPVTLGRINFDNANTYTLAGGNTITLDSSSGVASINVLSGSHAILSPVSLSKDLAISVAASSTLSLTGSLSAAGRDITKSGDGTAAFSSIRAANLSIDAGIVQITQKPTANSAGGTSVVTSLAISAMGQLDLTNNSLVIDYSVDSPFTAVQAMLQFGPTYGNGIISSTAITSPNPGEQGPTALGYAESADIFGPGGGTFEGVPVDDTAVLLKYTYAGDANLDGKVDITDLYLLASSWQTLNHWTRGDFNYDGYVDASDLGLLSANWQAGVSGATLGAPLDSLAAMFGLSVPEPSGLIVLSLAGLSLLRNPRVRRVDT